MNDFDSGTVNPTFMRGLSVKRDPDQPQQIIMFGVYDVEDEKRGATQDHLLGVFGCQQLLLTAKPT